MGWNYCTKPLKMEIKKHLNGQLTWQFLQVQLVLALQVGQREEIQRLAHNRVVWPLLTDGEPGWEKKAAIKIGLLDLGAALKAFRSRFRQARGANENYPARVWAMTAVRTIEESRLRLVMLQGFTDEICTLASKLKWEISDQPDWASQACESGHFCSASAPAWAKLIRAMVRQQMPDFHTHADWKNQRNTARLTGRDSIGELQNSILDDIGSALKRLAPPQCCRNWAAEV